jgi:hypothetical protein
VVVVVLILFEPSKNTFNLCANCINRIIRLPCAPGPLKIVQSLLFNNIAIPKGTTAQPSEGLGLLFWWLLIGFAVKIHLLEDFFITTNNIVFLAIVCCCVCVSLMPAVVGVVKLHVMDADPCPLELLKVLAHVLGDLVAHSNLEEIVYIGLQVPSKGLQKHQTLIERQIQQLL